MGRKKDTRVKKQYVFTTRDVDMVELLDNLKSKMRWGVSSSSLLERLIASGLDAEQRLGTLHDHARDLGPDHPYTRYLKGTEEESGG